MLLLTHRQKPLSTMGMLAVPRQPFTASSWGGGLFIVSFSSAWIAGNSALHSTGPLTLLLIRFGAAAVVLPAVSLLTGAPWPRRLADYGHLAVVGLLMHGLATAGVYVGLNLGVSAGGSGLIAGMSPIFTALAARFLLDEDIGHAQWLGLLIGLVAVALVVLKDLLHERRLGGLCSDIHRVSHVRLGHGVPEAILHRVRLAHQQSDPVHERWSWGPHPRG
jgi:drug/metabolite transporter (DMT)-like permease